MALWLAPSPSNLNKSNAAISCRRESKIGVAGAVGWGMCRGVRRWKAILSLLCLAIWLPATQHCHLENLPGLGFLRCAGDTDGKSDCAGDSCDTVEKGSYKPSDNQGVAPAPLFLAVIASLHLQADSPHSQNAGFEVATFPPPDLPKGWQFITRTAAPPRAPSFRS